MKKWLCILLAVTLCFSGLAAGFTYGLIQKHTAAPDPDRESTPPAQESHPQGIDLYGTYDENDLLFLNVSTTYRGAEISIPRIEGLKDKALEMQINGELEAKVYGLLESLGNITYASGSLMGNFCNVLSLYYSVGHDGGYSRLFFNYDLTTGRELRLEDLFYEDTDILSFVRGAFYEQLVLRTWSSDGPVSPDENQLYKLVKNYMEAENPEFAFTPAAVHFYSGDTTASVDFLDISTEVSVYHRFLTDTSIFADDNVGFDNIFTCADVSQFHVFSHMDFGQKGENLWYDVSSMSVWLPEGMTDEDKAAVETAKTALYAEIYADIDHYARIAGENPDKYYILLYKPSYHVLNNSNYVDNDWTYDISSAMETSWNVDIYELPMELYESTYRDKLIAAYRYQYFFMAGGAWIDRYAEEPDSAVHTHLDRWQLHNYRTGEELTLETVFREGADYEFIIRNELINRLVNGFYPEGPTSAAAAIELAQKAEIYLAGGTVRAEIPGTEVDLWYSLTQFPRDMLTIFD